MPMSEGCEACRGNIFPQDTTRCGAFVFIVETALSNGQDAPLKSDGIGTFSETSSMTAACIRRRSTRWSRIVPLSRYHGPLTRTP